jgi:ribokinase
LGGVVLILRSILLPGVNHAPGASPDELLAALPRQPGFLILQNEIPWDITTAYASFFGAKGTDVVFNPSPMPSQAQLEAFPWKQLAVLIVNEGEAADLLAALSSQKADSSSDAKATLEALVALPQFSGLKWLVLTLGSQGVIASVALQGGRQVFASPASKPQAVRDTTGAGDTFAGNLVTRLSEVEGELQAKQVEEALRWAGQAAAMAVEKEGALESIPKRQDVQQRLQG